MEIMSNSKKEHNKGSTRPICKCKLFACTCASPPSDDINNDHNENDNNNGDLPPVPIPVEESEYDLHRVKSLTETEKHALVSLFIDAPPSSSAKDVDGDQTQNLVLTDEMLFSTPYQKAVAQTSPDKLSNTSDTRTPNSHSKTEEKQQTLKHHTGLWKAHEIGIRHHLNLNLRSKFSRKMAASLKVPVPNREELHKSDQMSEQRTSTRAKENEHENDRKEKASNHRSSITSIYTATKSDMSQCGSKSESESVGSSSSWDDVPGHYDTWQVMSDEYAKDFGFDYKPYSKETAAGGDANTDEDEDEDTARFFQILGTSSVDCKAQPHVLSPPLMDTLLNFVPESLSSDNWWLKYSLVRDGASLETLRSYCRAAQCTLIAIQTTKGDVFGSFTTQPWHIGEHGYFGSGESFVWKMRHNRFHYCCSLYEQAQMESECDVFPFSGLNNCFQFCAPDILGVGGGEIDHSLSSFNDDAAKVFKDKSLGFAFALHDDLLRGTTSQSATFCNKILTHDSDEVFDVSNLEVWTFTPCTSVEDAEHLEMRKYFLHESMRKQSLSVTSLGSSEMPSSPMSSQRMFYRRIGESGGNEDQMNQWAATISKIGKTKSTSHIRSPRFIS